MPTKKQSQGAPSPKGAPTPKHEGNLIPAQYTVELADYEAQLHVTLEKPCKHWFQNGPLHTLRCTLTGRTFQVCADSLLYALVPLGDDCLFDPPHLHPDIVTKGGAYLRRLILEKAALARCDIRFKMEKVAMMERGAQLDIVFDTPEA